MYTGFRLSEWAQSHSCVSKNKQKQATLWKLSRKQDSISIIKHDITFGYSIDGTQHVAIRYRWQKNGQNGEKVLYGASANPNRCPVIAASNILRRAELLKIPDDAPLSWFCINKERHLITDKYITKALRNAARTAHSVSNSTDLNRWSPHSIRVGACVALHEAGADTLLIQNQHRWRSDAFLVYLRHTPFVAARHSKLLLS